MSTLIVDEMYPGVIFAQPVTITKDFDVAFIRPWVLSQGTLSAGTFTCRVKEGATVLKEGTIDYTDINSGKTEDYAHGFMRFDMHPLVLRVPSGQESAVYTVEFEMVGGVQDSINFIGICRAFEERVYDTPTPPANSMISPAGFELYEFKESKNG
jgi:hypothetical protein